MRIKAPCAVCVNMDPAVLTIGDGLVTDSGLVHVSCPNGHKSAIIYEERKYMLLLISACQALLDSHGREAVSSIAAALERCYEFFIRVSLRKHGITPGDLNNIWKSIASQSERQFGAFAALYAAESQKPFVLPPKISEFRNKVTHKGYFPTDKEVLKFGREVFELIQEISKVLETLGNDHVKAVEQAAYDAQESEVPVGMEYATTRAFGVRVDKNNKVVGPIGTFDDFLRLIASGSSQKWGWGR